MFYLDGELTERSGCGPPVARWRTWLLDYSASRRITAMSTGFFGS